MRTLRYLLFFSIGCILFSCHNNSAKNNTNPVGADTKLKHADTPFILKPVLCLREWGALRCIPHGLPVEEQIHLLKAEARKGDGDAVSCLWDLIFFHASWYNSITDPMMAYDVYLDAKKKNPNLTIGNEARKLATIKKCLEAGPFDIKDFLKKNNIKQDSEKTFFDVWEIARKLSLDRLPTKPNPKLIFQIVCYGGSLMGDLSKAIDSTYYNWKHNRTAIFEPRNYINDDMCTDASRCFPTEIESIEADEDNKYKMKNIAAMMRDNTGSHLYGVVNTAEKFFESLAYSEECNGGGSGSGCIMLGSFTAHKRAYWDMIESIIHDTLPEPLIGDSTSDIRLNETYRKLITQLRKQPVIGMGGNIILYTEAEVGIETKWISYRDSTAQMLGIMRPDIGEEKWRQWLTEERIKQLENVLNIAKGLN